MDVATLPSESSQLSKKNNAALLIPKLIIITSLLAARAPPQFVYENSYAMSITCQLKISKFP